MKTLTTPFNLNFVLVNNSQSYEMKSLEDLQWFLLRCIDAKHEDDGRNRCLKLRWDSVRVSEKEVRKISKFLKSRLIGRIELEVIVRLRGKDGLEGVKFINNSAECKECGDRVDCLTAERL